MCLSSPKHLAQVEFSLQFEMKRTQCTDLGSTVTVFLRVVHI